MTSRERLMAWLLVLLLGAEVFMGWMYVQLHKDSYTLEVELAHQRGEFARLQETTWSLARAVLQCTQ